MVFVTCIQRQRREYLLQRWELVDRSPVVTCEIVLSRSGPDQSVNVSSTDEPLVLRFEDVFARHPGEDKSGLLLNLLPSFDAKSDVPRQANFLFA